MFKFQEKQIKPHFAVFICPVADEGASGRIFTLVMVVSAIGFCVFVYFDILDIFLRFNKPELFAADFALVAINPLLVAFSWFWHNL